MKKHTPKLFRTLLFTATSLATAGAQAALTDGFSLYTSSFTVQNRTTGCGGFTDLGGGQFKTWVCAGEERVEMRWDNWPNQNTANQFECDAMFDSDTQSTAIHQIKSNTGGEPIYLQVHSPGALRNDNGSDFATGMANVWFHVNSMFNPVSGDGSLYINGSLKVTRSFPTTDRQWYFKNGTYNNGLPSGHKSTAWFKNIKHWVKSSASVNFEAENVAVTASGTTTSSQTDANSSNGIWIQLDGTATGQWMEFTTPQLAPGTYSVRMMWKGNNNRGQLNLKVDGTQVGGTLDQYSAAQTYPTTTFGNVTFTTSTTHKIRLTVTGKNASSSSFKLSADKFTLVPQ
jgi:hypothetical protein